MTELWSAEEWADACQDNDYGNTLLCLACARAYAAQVGEAVREEIANLHIEGGAFAAAIRQIEVKTP